MAYTTRDLILGHLGRASAAQTDRMYVEADAAVAAVKLAVDNYCNRSFDKATATRREFLAPRGCRDLVIGDHTAVTQIETRRRHDDPWTVLDPAMWADGLPPESQPTWPRRDVWLLPGNGMWPYAPPPVTTVRVTASYGWLAVPDDVQKAALYWACSMVQEQAVPLTDADGDIAVDTGAAFRQQNLAKRLLREYQIVAVA